MYVMPRSTMVLIIIFFSGASILRLNRLDLFLSTFLVYTISICVFTYVAFCVCELFRLLVSPLRLQSLPTV